MALDNCLKPLTCNLWPYRQLFKREQLEKLDKETLIELLLHMQTHLVALEEQVTVLTTTVQKLQDL